MTTKTTNKVMTLRRIKAFLAKWPEEKSKPAAVRMLADMVGLFEKNVDERVDALLKAMLEDEQRYERKLHEAEQWFVKQLQSRTATDGGLNNEHQDEKPTRQHGRQRTTDTFG